MTEIPEINGQASLARKMAQVMLNMRRVEKGGTNKDQGWSYGTYDDIADAVRGEMGKCGLALFTSMINATSEIIGKTQKGANVTHATVELQFKIVCADTGTFEIMHWTGAADDYSDKALNKAGTYATKFWMKNTFLISTGDDPDAEAPVVDNASKKPAPPVYTPAWASPENIETIIKTAIDNGYLEVGDDLSDALALVSEHSLEVFNTGKAFSQAIRNAGERVKAAMEQPAPDGPAEPEKPKAKGFPEVASKTVHPKPEPTFNIVTTPEMLARANNGKPADDAPMFSDDELAQMEKERA